MKIQVTGEQDVDQIDVNGGQPSRTIEVAAGLVSSVNGQTGAVTGLATTTQVTAAQAAATAAAAADTTGQIAAHTAAADPHGDRAYTDSRLATWVNVKHSPYNAAGDGVTDDTVAVQAAIDAGGVTCFPPGTYLVGTLQARTGMVLQGVGRSGYIATSSAQAATLKLKNGTNAALLNGADQISNAVIRNLNFDGNKAGNSSGSIINLVAGSAQDTAWHIHDCFLNNAATDGITIGAGRQAVKVSRTWIMRAATNGITANGADGGYESVLIGLSGANGIYAGAWVQHLIGCDIWSSGANGVLSDNAHMVSLTNCGIDRHQQSGVVVQTGGSVAIMGCLFHSNSQAANATYPHIAVAAGQVTVIGNTFATDGLTNNPNYGVNITGGTVREWGNNQSSGSFVTGFINPATSVNNFITGSLSLDTARQINVGASGSGATFAALRANATDGILSGRATGDTVNRYGLTAAGTQTWGPGGAAAQDITLSRGAANRLDLATSDLSIATAGRGLKVAEGTNAKMGLATLAAGTVTVATTAVTANSRIYLTGQGDTAGTEGWLRVSARVAGTSFTITSSSGTDTSTVAWMIVEPA